MAAPVAYTEPELQAYMLDVLADVASALGMTELSLQEAVNDTLLAYGVADIAAATDIPRLRALARVAAWRAALARASSWYRFSADGATYNREQVAKQIRDMLGLAEADAAAYDGGTGGVQVAVLAVRLTDPYRVSDESVEAEGVN